MNLEQARTNMIKQQLRTCDVLDDNLLALINSTPRADFVPQAYERLAYADTLLPIGHDQTMMLPVDEARMIQALAIQTDEKVLEVGTGTGYVTALLAQLAQQVFSVDIFPDFIDHARHKLAQFNIGNVHLTVGDAAQGWPHHSPFDVIVITGALPFLPQAYKQSLAVGGRMFAIIGTGSAMVATLFHHDVAGSWHEQVLFETSIAPLLNVMQRDAFVF